MYKVLTKSGEYLGHRNSFSEAYQLVMDSATSNPEGKIVRPDGTTIFIEDRP